MHKNSQYSNIFVYQYTAIPYEWDFKQKMAKIKQLSLKKHQYLYKMSECTINCIFMQQIELYVYVSTHLLFLINVTLINMQLQYISFAYTYTPFTGILFIPARSPHETDHCGNPRFTLFLLIVGGWATDNSTDLSFFSPF